MLNSEYSATIPTEAVMLSAFQEVEQLREQVEFLNVRVDSLQHIIEQLDSELLDKQRQILELEQELAKTNCDLCHALAAPEQKTREPQQITPEEPTRKSQNESNKSIDRRTDLIDKPQTDKIAITADTPLSILGQQATKNSQEAIVRSKQLKAQYNELGFQFISFRAKFAMLNEQMTEIVTQWQQPEDGNLPFQLVTENRNKSQENLKQLKAHWARSKELLKDSMELIVQTKSELIKLQEFKEDLKQADFCEAKIGLSNPAKQDLTSILCWQSVKIFVG